MYFGKKVSSSDGGRCDLDAPHRDETASQSAASGPSNLPSLLREIAISRPNQIWTADRIYLQAPLMNSQNLSTSCDATSLDTRQQEGLG